MDKTERKKLIDESLKSIEKAFGKGSIMKLGDEDVHEFTDVIPTGSLALDKALGIGGVPKGRIVEIFGLEGAGKTTVSLSILAECQKMGGIGAFIDVEHALDLLYAKNIGVDTGGLIISQPDSGEQALEICEMLVKGGGIDLIIIDSVAALVSRAEIEGDMGDSHVALVARLMSQALRKLTSVVSNQKVCVIFINQLRFNIGVTFGNPYTTPGGLALKFHASVRLEVVKGETLKNGDIKIGNKPKIKVVKNKFAPPFKDAQFNMYYGKGVCKEEEILELGEANNIIEKTGAWYSYKGEKVAQGKEQAVNWLNSKPEVKLEIEKEIKKILKLI